MKQKHEYKIPRNNRNAGKTREKVVLREGTIQGQAYPKHILDRPYLNVKALFKMFREMLKIFFDIVIWNDFYREKKREP